MSQVILCTLCRIFRDSNGYDFWIVPSLLTNTYQFILRFKFSTVIIDKFGSIGSTLIANDKSNNGELITKMVVFWRKDSQYNNAKHNDTRNHSKDFGYTSNCILFVKNATSKV